MKSDSDESRNYVSDLLSGSTARPEDLFVQKFLSVDFWKELGFFDNEIKIEYPAGVGGRVEITLLVEGQKIAIECKRPYLVKNGEAIKHELNGDDILELKDQIALYLLSHSFVIFTNGFHWFFYSRESYSLWLTNKGKKDIQLKPYFHHLTAEEIFSDESTHYILNILQRQNILESLSGMGDQSIRHILTDEFFVDLKTWVGFIDTVLRDTPSDVKSRTTQLINKLIFVRTMEGVGVIPYGFLARLWDNKKGVRNSTVDFIDHIDDELSEIYDTELFTPKFVVDEDGNPILKEGLPQYSKDRQKNYAYKALPEEFLSAILHPPDSLNLNDLGKTRVILNGKEHYVRSLYWWRFESIPADILGKAYETYLARERKKLGIYYTPHQITEYLTSTTIKTILDEKFLQLKKELDEANWDIEKIKSIANHVRNFKICDPSCGSGSFLIQAVRILWKKYMEFEGLIRLTIQKTSEGKAVLDDYFTEKAGVLKFLELVFRIRDRQERLGTIILRHIYGNDKDVKAVDTAKLNIWLECLRLDPNSFRRDVLKGKRHALPNLELNITVGDSLIGLDPEGVDKALTRTKDALKSIFSLTEKYVESFDKTSIAQSAVDIRRGLQGFVDHALVDKLGLKYTSELLDLLEPTHWALHHLDAFYDKNGELKPLEERGFDVIIGNPPWEILEPNINEFYGPLYNSEDMTKFSLLTKGEKNKIVEKLSKEPKVRDLWEQYNREIDIQQDYYNKFDFYKYQIPELETKRNKIKMNLYKLFVERYHQLLKIGGIAGVVLPSGIYTDLGSKGLRQLIFHESNTISLYGFENRKGIFEEIHRQFKFLTLVFKKGENTKSFKSAFYVTDVNQLSTLDQDALVYEIDFIQKTSPISLSILECKNKSEVSIIKKITKFSSLIDPEWNLDFQREFNMTDDAPLFNTIGKGGILYEGKMIHQFTHTFEKPRYWIEYDKGLRELESRGKHNMSRSLKSEKKKTKSEIIAPKIRISAEYYRIAWRLISNATNQRTLICTILPPKAFLGNSLNYVKPIYFDGESFNMYLTYKEILYLCGCLNSFVVDFLMRHKVAININIFYMSEITVPRLHEGEHYFSEIVERVGSLICTTPEYDDLKREIGIKQVITEPLAREKIIAQINAYVAQIYNLTKTELEYILNTFPLVEEKSKQMVLDEFDKINK